MSLTVNNNNTRIVTKMDQEDTESVPETKDAADLDKIRDHFVLVTVNPQNTSMDTNAEEALLARIICDDCGADCGGNCTADCPSNCIGECTCDCTIDICNTDSCVKTPESALA